MAKQPRSRVEVKEAGPDPSIRRSRYTGDSKMRTAVSHRSTAKVHEMLVNLNQVRLLLRTYAFYNGLDNITRNLKEFSEGYSCCICEGFANFLTNI